MTDSVTMLQAIGRFLVSIHQREARVDEARSWLFRRDPPRPACDGHRDALELGPATQAEALP